MDEARVRGNDAFARKEWDAAIAAYDAGISARSTAGLPQDRRLYSNRAAAYVSKYIAVRKAGLEIRGLLALAVKDAETATSLSPSWAKGWYRLFVAHVAGNDNKAALDAVSRGLEHCPNDPDLCRAYRNLKNLNTSSDEVPTGEEKSGQPQPGDAERFLGDAALEAGDWRGAIENYTQSIELAVREGLTPDRRAYCNRSAAWLRAAVESDEENAFAAAIADANRCIAIDSAWPKAWYRKAAAFLEDGRPGYAKHVFEQGLRCCPYDGELRAGLVQANAVIEEEGPESDWEDSVHQSVAGSLITYSGQIDDEASQKGTSVQDEYGDGLNITVPNGEFGFQTLSFAQQASVDPRDGNMALCVRSDSESDSSVSGKLRLGENSGFRNQVDTTTATSSISKPSTIGATESVLFKHFDGSKTERSGANNPTNLNSTQITRPDKNHRTTVPKNETNDLPIVSNSKPPVPQSSHIDKAARRYAGLEKQVEDEATARRLKSAPECRNDDNKLEIPGHGDGITGQNSKSVNRGLSELLNECGDSEAENSKLTCSAGHQKVETLYDLLGVSSNATEIEIRRAYREVARKNHPDKNLTDPDATAKFQRISDAYRVLSNAESRALYDKYGHREFARNGVEAVDPSKLFAMVFGSDHFGHLIGELQVASLANAVDDNGNAPSTEVLERIQKERVGKLAVQLIRMTIPWVEGQREEFVEWANKEAKRLSTANFGTQLLHVVGRAYCACAAVCRAALVGAGKRGVRSLSSTISGAVAGGVYRTQRARAQLAASSAASKVMAKQRRVHDRVLRLGRGGRALSANEAERMAVEMAECAVDMMWKLAVVDIETTIADVVSATLSGKDVTDAGLDVVIERAGAIQALGRAFVAVQSQDDDDLTQMLGRRSPN